MAHGKLGEEKRSEIENSAWRKLQRQFGQQCGWDEQKMP